MKYVSLNPNKFPSKIIMNNHGHPRTLWIRVQIKIKSTSIICYTLKNFKFGSCSEMFEEFNRESWTTEALSHPRAPGKTVHKNYKIYQRENWLFDKRYTSSRLISIYELLCSIDLFVYSIATKNLHHVTVRETFFCAPFPSHSPHLQLTSEHFNIRIDVSRLWAIIELTQKPVQVREELYIHT